MHYKFKRLDDSGYTPHTSISILKLWSNCEDGRFVYVLCSDCTCSLMFAKDSELPRTPVNVRFARARLDVTILVAILFGYDQHLLINYPSRPNPASVCGLRWLLRFARRWKTRYTVVCTSAYGLGCSLCSQIVSSGLWNTIYSIVTDICHRTGVHSGNVNIVKREWWGAMQPRDPDPFISPLNYIIYTYTRGKRCTNKRDCLQRVRCLQAMHMQQGMSDIKWNFLIGGDDNVYEGRGWKHKPPKNSFVPQLDGKAIEVAYIGNFSAAAIRHPTKLMWLRGWQLMVHALKNKIMTEVKIAFDWMLEDDQPFGNLFQWPDFPEGHPDRRTASEGDTTPLSDDVDDPDFHLSWGLRHSPFFKGPFEQSRKDGGQEALSDNELFNPGRPSKDLNSSEVPKQPGNGSDQVKKQCTELNSDDELNFINSSKHEKPSEVPNAFPKNSSETPISHLKNPSKNTKINERGTLIVNDENFLECDD